MPEPITVDCQRDLDRPCPAAQRLQWRLFWRVRRVANLSAGEARGPLCGMGICFECRATVNGQPHCRSCQIICQPGMEVRTDE